MCTPKKKYCGGGNGNETEQGGEIPGEKKSKQNIQKFAMPTNKS